MEPYPTNQQRTDEYLKRFDRQKILKHLLQGDHPTILDVGSNSGTSADEFKQWWPDSTIHCFEPQQECWPDLDSRAAHHAGIIVNKLAVGNRPADRVPFFSHAISTGVSGFHRINLNSLDSIDLNRKIANDRAAKQDYEDSVNHERTVSVIRLDDYLQAAGVPRVDLLKIDTQGYEPEVLDGLGSRLGDVDVVLSELMFYDFYERSLSFSDLERLLLPAGFRLYDISHIAKNPMNGRTDWVDVIYVHDRMRNRARRS